MKDPYQARNTHTNMEDGWSIMNVFLSKINILNVLTDTMKILYLRKSVTPSVLDHLHVLINFDTRF